MLLLSPIGRGQLRYDTKSTEDTVQGIACFDRWMVCVRRQLLAHLGFEDVLPQVEGAAIEASLAAAAECLQLTSPRDGAAGTSPPRNGDIDANGNSAFGDEGGPLCLCWLALNCR